MDSNFGPNSIKPPALTPRLGSKIVGSLCCVTNSTIRGRSFPRMGPYNTTRPWLTVLDCRKRLIEILGAGHSDRLKDYAELRRCLLDVLELERHPLQVRVP